MDKSKWTKADEAGSCRCLAMPRRAKSWLEKKRNLIALVRKYITNCISFLYCILISQTEGKFQICRLTYFNSLASICLLPLGGGGKDYGSRVVGGGKV